MSEKFKEKFEKFRVLFARVFCDCGVLRILILGCVLAILLIYIKCIIVVVVVAAIGSTRMIGV